MFYITKKFKFDAAHNLINYKGNCEKIHGHTYFLEITFKGKNLQNGMLLDFKKLKKIVNKKIISKLDHTYLNDIIKISTAENIALWIKKQLEKQKFPNDAVLYEIKLYEGPDSFVCLRDE